MTITDSTIKPAQRENTGTYWAALGLLLFLGLSGLALPFWPGLDDNKARVAVRLSSGKSRARISDASSPGDDHQVTEAAERALRSDPDNLRALVYMAQSYLRVGEWTRAQTLLNRAIESSRKTVQRDPANLQASLVLAETLFLAARPAEAEKVLARAVATHPGDAEAHLTQGHFYQLTHDHDRAERAYLTAVRIAPRNAGAHLSLGQIYALRGKVDLAEAQYHQALGIDPQYLPAKKALAHLWLETEHVPRADRLVDDILADRPGDIDGLYLEGRIKLAQGAAHEATTALEKISRREPTYQFGSHPPDLGYFLGLAYCESGLFEEAKTELVKVLDHYPGSLSVQLLVAQIAYSFREFRRAAEIVQGTLKDHPDNLQAALMLGPALLRATTSPPFKGDPRQVERVLQSGAEAHQSAPVYDDALGDFYQTQGQRDLAEAAYRAASERAPQNSGAHLVLGAMLLTRGKDAEAQVHLKKAIELDPAQARPHFTMGVLFEKRGARQQAVESYERALRIDPHFSEAANNLAALLSDTQKDLARASHLAKQAALLLPDDPNVLDTLGWLRYRSRNYSGAVGLLEKCVQKRPSGSLFQYHLGMAYYASGNSKAARASLEEFLRLDPGSPNQSECRRLVATLGGQRAGL